MAHISKSSITIKMRVEGLISGIKYSQIRLCAIPHVTINAWCQKRLPKTLQAFANYMWDLNLDSTTEEVACTNAVLNWYGRKVAVYFTYSHLAHGQAKTFLASRLGKNYRETFGFDHHITILLSPTMFFLPEDLDEFWATISINQAGGKNWSALDFSHYDDNDDVVDEYAALGWHSLNLWDTEDLDTLTNFQTK
jgi:hypothetical protein